MARKSKINQLLNFMITKSSYDLSDSPIRLGKDVILNDPTLNIARSTLYNIIKNHDYLDIEGEYVVYKQDRHKYGKMNAIMEKIIAHYDPEQGQKAIPLETLFPDTDEREENLEYVQELSEKPWELIQYKEGEIKFTLGGLRFYKNELGWESQRTLELCKICLKPFKLHEPIYFRTQINEYDDFGTHCECKSTQEREETHPFSLTCAYCGLPLSIVRYAYSIAEKQYGYLNTVKINLKKMDSEDREKILKMAIEYFVRNNYAQFKTERDLYKEECEEYEKKVTEKTLSKFEKKIYNPETGFAKHRLPDTLETIFKGFFDAFRTGILLDDQEPPELLYLISKYQIAEYQTLLEQQLLVEKTLKEFCDFTGLYPYPIEYSYQNVVVPRSTLSSFVTPDWASYVTFSDGERLYHPKCIKRFQKGQENAEIANGGNN